MEIWKDIPGYEGKYQASNFGNIKSIPRQYKKMSTVKNQCAGKSYAVEKTFTVRGKVKKLTKGTHGYYVVNLGLNDVVTVHTLVARAFLPSIVGKTHVDHINSIRTDNRIENLQWVTQQENNSKQKFAKGSERSSFFKENDIIQIRSKYSESKAYKTIEEIAASYGCSVATIYDIIKRRTWNHVEC